MRDDPMHPSAEDLAALVDGTISAELRARLVEHVAGCEECHEIVSTSTMFGSSAGETRADGARPLRWRPLALAGTLAAAAAAALVLVAPLREWTKRLIPGRDTPMVVDVAGKYRTAEARLAGFPHAPMVPATRGADDPDDTRLALVEIRRKLKRELETAPSAQSEHELGRASLLLGEHDDAILWLEKAGTSSKSAVVASDLAAAYLARGAERRDPQDYARAVDAADRALRLDPKLPEALFNRALALEALHIRLEAIPAWKAYLEVDANSGWSEEARRHLHALETSVEPLSWQKDKERLDSRSVTDDDLERMARVHRRQVRRYFEEEVPAAWGESILRGDTAGAAATLELMRRAGGVLAESGERLVIDLATSLEASRGAQARSLAEGHIAVRDAMLAFSRQEPAASKLLDEAETRFAAESAAWWLVQQRRMSADFNRFRFTPPEELASLARTCAQRNYTGMLADTHWLQGLMAIVAGRPHEGIEHYQAALNLFEKTGEIAGEAGIRTLLAEACTFLGDDDSAWMHQHESIALAERTGSDRAVLMTLSGAAATAFRSGFHGASRAYYDAATSLALKLDNPHYAAECLVGSALSRDSHEAEAARSDLERARAEASRIPDPEIRARTGARVDIATARVWETADPERAEAAAGAALAYYRGRDDHLPVAQLLHERAKLRLARGNPRGAEDDLREGIREVEQQREGLADSHKISFLADAYGLYDDLVSVLLNDGRRDEAFEIAERGHGRALLDLVAARAAGAPAEAPPREQRPMGLNEIARGLEANTVIVEYAALPERLAIWAVDASGLRGFAESPVRARDLETLVEESVVSLTRGETPGKARDSRLWALLVSQVLPLVPRDGTVVFVPDKALHGFPFASLRDPATGRYLIESHVMTTAQSASMFARAAGKTGLENRSVLAVGNPAIDRREHPELRSLLAAEHEAENVAALYPGSTMLRGAEATREAFLREAPRHGVIHYAGHAIARRTGPTFSQLVLAPDATRSESGALYAHEIRGLELDSCRLVVLAACSTAAGKQWSGEGVTSIARSFLAAGARNVVAALWDVDDVKTAALLEAFHREVARGASPAQALRTAQISMLRSGDSSLRAAGVWAAFISTGSG